ncbi:hypothetical protein LJC27_01175 [Christensenellaceae bacterium OttesenSCG-928-M15]|nr:hypothetical protein [Christensenellaceae bacterium OttesenSCG-928-M15]
MQVVIIFSCILAAVLLAAGLLLLLPVTVHIHGDLRLFSGGSIKIRLRFLFSLIRWSMTFRLNILDEPPLQIIQIKKKKERVIWEPGMKKKAEQKIDFPVSMVWDRVKTKKISLQGEAGVLDDAAASALLSGAVFMAAVFAWSYFNRKKDTIAPQIAIRPVNNRDCLWLKLEWIGSLRPVHIITAIIRSRESARKGKQETWHIQSKTF